LISGVHRFYYRSKYGRYTGSFDTLINFIKFDSLALVFRKGQVTDEMVAKGLDEREALKSRAYYT
jgi:hypothetical protein